MTTPLVSILIPSYNRAGMIGDAIRSALAQTYKFIEVVVVDNASTDTTWKEIQEIAKTDPRVRAFRNDRNIGPVRNWIECINHAQGLYAKIIWSDDLIDVRFLEKTVPLLENSNVGFVYTAAQIFSDDSSPERGAIRYNNLPSGIHPSETYIEGILLNENFPVSPGCALFRCEDLSRNMWLDIPTATTSNFSQHAIGNDLLIFLLTSCQYRNFAVVNEPLSFFRDHASSITSGSDTGKLILHYDMIRAYFSENYMSNSELNRKLNSMIWLHLKKYNGQPYNLTKISDFHHSPHASRIDIKYITQKILNRMLCKN